jgi:hypothetical protein
MRCWQQQDKCAGTEIKAALKALCKAVQAVMTMVFFRIFTTYQTLVPGNSTVWLLSSKKMNF